MPTGHYTRWNFDSETGTFTPRQNNTRSFEHMVMSYFQRTRPECVIENFFTRGRQRKIENFSVEGICSHCNTPFEAMGCFYHFCPCQELRPSLSEEDIQCGSKKRELYALRGYCIQEKGFKVIVMWECDGGECIKQPILLNNVSESTFLTGVQLQLSNFQKK